MWLQDVRRRYIDLGTILERRGTVAPWLKIVHARFIDLGRGNCNDGQGIRCHEETKGQLFEESAQVEGGEGLAGTRDFTDWDGDTIVWDGDIVVWPSAEIVRPRERLAGVVQCIIEFPCESQFCGWNRCAETVRNQAGEDV